METSIVKKESPAALFSVVITIILMGFGLLVPSYFTDACEICIKVRSDANFFLLITFLLVVSAGAVKYAVFGFQKKVEINWDDKTIKIESIKMFNGPVLKTYSAGEIDRIRLETSVDSPDGKIVIKFSNGDLTSIPCSSIADPILDFLGRANLLGVWAAEGGNPRC
jgi:hypothetical protein